MTAPKRRSPCEPYVTPEIPPGPTTLRLRAELAALEHRAQRRRAVLRVVAIGTLLGILAAWLSGCGATNEVRQAAGLMAQDARELRHAWRCYRFGAEKVAVDLKVKDADFALMLDAGAALERAFGKLETSADRTAEVASK